MEQPETGPLCIFCGSTGPWSDEHVLSEFLGCRVVLKEGVCRNCNSRFGRVPEGQLYKTLLPFLEFCGVPAAEEERRDKVWTGTIHERPVKFETSADRTSVEMIHPVVRKNRLEDGRWEVIFTGTEKQYQDHLKNLARRNVPVTPLESTPRPDTIELEAETDFLRLYGEPCLTAVLKYAANFCLRRLGSVELTRTLGRAAHAALEGKASTAITVGPYADVEVLNRLALCPPLHKCLVAPTDQSGKRCVLVILFSMLPFYVMAEVSDPNLYYASAEAYPLLPADPSSSCVGIYGEVQIPVDAEVAPGSREWRRAIRTVAHNCARVLPNIARACAGIDITAAHES